MRFERHFRRRSCRIFDIFFAHRCQCIPLRNFGERATCENQPGGKAWYAAVVSATSGSNLRQSPRPFIFHHRNSFAVHNFLLGQYCGNHWFQDFRTQLLHSLEQPWIPRFRINVHGHVWRRMPGKGLTSLHVGAAFNDQSHVGCAERVKIDIRGRQPGFAEVAP